MRVIPVYVLAGGRSLRFGSDKARALVSGVPLLARVAEFARALGREPVVVAEVAGKYEDLGLRTIADELPGHGPLGGLHAALADLARRRASGTAARGRDPGEALLLVSCDFVVLRVTWIRTLVGAIHGSAAAAAFHDDHWEPLPGIYTLRLREALERRMRSDSGDSLRGLLDAVGAVRVPLPADWPALAHVNTPDELARAADAEGTI